MPKENDQLPDFSVMDFSGGVRTDKGNTQIKDDELAFANNVEMLPGRISKRYGSIAFGGFKTGFPNTNELFTTGIYNRGLNVQLLANKNILGDGGMVYKLVAEAYFSSYDGVSVININGQTTNYAAAGTIEIEGDIITYTGKTGSSFTGVSGITISPAHTSGAIAKQWVPIYGSAVGTSQGVWFAYLNALIIISRGDPTQYGMETYNGTTTGSISLPTLGNNFLSFITTYKQRVYGVPANNKSQVMFSALNDGTSYTATDYFNVEDDIGEDIVNLWNYRGHLLIFKQNSTFYYNLSVLAQVNNQVGTWNDKTVTEINGALYTYAPKGAYTMSGRYFQMRDIGQPVKKFLDAFNAGVVTSQSGSNNAGSFPNCGRYNNKWLIYIGDIIVDQQSYTDVVLVYDTVYRYWTVWSGFSNLQGWINTVGYYGDGGIGRNQLFFCDDAKNVYQMFNNANVNRGISFPYASVLGNINADLFKNTGSAVSSEFQTKMYTLRTVGWMKRFMYMRIYAELWPFDVEYRILQASGNGNWRPLGQVKGPETLLKIGAEGYGIQFRFMESSKNDPFALLGFVLEGTTLLTQNHR